MIQKWRGWRISSCPSFGVFSISAYSGHHCLGELWCLELGVLDLGVTSAQGLRSKALKSKHLRRRAVALILERKERWPFWSGSSSQIFLSLLQTNGSIWSDTCFHTWNNYAGPIVVHGRAHTNTCFDLLGCIYQRMFEFRNEGEYKIEFSHNIFLTRGNLMEMKWLQLKNQAVKTQNEKITMLSRCSRVLTP